MFPPANVTTVRVMRLMMSAIMDTVLLALNVSMRARRYTISIFAQVMKEWWQMEMKILNELAGMLEDINPNEIVSHILDGTLLSWLASWKMKSQMLVAFLLENEKSSIIRKGLKNNPKRH